MTIDATTPQITVIEIDSENIGAQGSLTMEIEAKLREKFPPSVIKVSTESLADAQDDCHNAFDATTRRTNYCPDRVVYAANASQVGFSDVVAFTDLAEASTQDEGQTDKALILVGSPETDVGEAVPVMIDTASRMGFSVHTSIESWLKKVQLV